jgi:hypothetical protein
VVTVTEESPQEKPDGLFTKQAACRNKHPARKLDANSNDERTIFYPRDFDAEDVHKWLEVDSEQVINLGVMA